MDHLGETYPPCPTRKFPNGHARHTKKQQGGLKAALLSGE